MSSNNTSNQGHCVHTESTPRGASATTAAEAFCTCMERHVLQNAINRIAAEEALLTRVEQAAERLLGEEGGAAETVRLRIERASAVLRQARAAWRGGRGLTNATSAEGSAAPSIAERAPDHAKDDAAEDGKEHVEES